MWLLSRCAQLRRSVRSWRRQRSAGVWPTNSASMTSSGRCATPHRTRHTSVRTGEAAAFGWRGGRGWGGAGPAQWRRGESQRAHPCAGSLAPAQQRLTWWRGRAQMRGRAQERDVCAAGQLGARRRGVLPHSTARCDSARGPPRRTAQLQALALAEVRSCMAECVESAAAAARICCVAQR
jgi:hypothetical protein